MLGESLYTNVAAGVLSGAISSSIANPTDVLKVFIIIEKYLLTNYILKVRMQAASLDSYDARLSVSASFSKIYHSEGFRGLYRVS